MKIAPSVGENRPNFIETCFYFQAIKQISLIPERINALIFKVGSRLLHPATQLLLLQPIRAATNPSSLSAVQLSLYTTRNGSWPFWSRQPSTNDDCLLWPSPSTVPQIHWPPKTKKQPSFSQGLWMIFCDRHCCASSSAGQTLLFPRSYTE